MVKMIMKLSHTETRASMRITPSASHMHDRCRLTSPLHSYSKAYAKLPVRLYKSSRDIIAVWGPKSPA